MMMPGLGAGILVLIPAGLTMKISSINLKQQVTLIYTP